MGLTDVVRRYCHKVVPRFLCSSLASGSSKTSSQVTTRSRAVIAAHRQLSSVVFTTIH